MAFAGLFSLGVVLATVWCTLALWYRLPASEAVRGVAAGLFALLGLAAAALSFGRLRWRVRPAFLAIFLLVLVWWGTIRPPADGDWAADVAKQVTGEISGDRLTLSNMRSFTWHSATEAEQNWTTRSYDLNGLRTLDLFMSYWSGTAIAHVMLSFGFDDGSQLAWSIEVRRREGGEFSPLADLFKSNPLIILASDERDVVGVRSNLRREDVQIYRLRASPKAARLLLLQYVEDANALAAAPEFYNSLTTNCTTTIVTMARAAGDALPLDWRLVVNGHLPEYLYDHGAVDTTIPMARLRDLSHIDQRAAADGLSPNFSRAVRVGVPSPIPASDQMPP